MKVCIWCLKNENEKTFNNKAHTIPKSLGGQNYNINVCDECNSFFGEKIKNMSYSIEEALKETFCITRERLLIRKNVKKKVGKFKSRFFEFKEKEGKKSIALKTNIFLNHQYQIQLCRNFKRGLIKLWFEEFTRQNFNENFSSIKYDLIRNFARYDIGDVPVFYFVRSFGAIIMRQKEPETPIMIFNRNLTFLNNDYYTEFEFLGHVFGFPFFDFGESMLNMIINESLNSKKGYYKNCKKIITLMDVDFTLEMFNT